MDNEVAKQNGPKKFKRKLAELIKMIRDTNELFSKEPVSMKR